MNRPRYDRPLLLDVLRTLTHGHPSQCQVMVVSEVGVPLQLAAAVNRLMGHIAETAAGGQEPDFGLLPGMAVTAETPEHDIRCKMLWRAEQNLVELGGIGAVRLPHPAGSRLTAEQYVSGEKSPPMMLLNRAIRGVFWSYLQPASEDSVHIDIGWELRDSDPNDTVITVLKGHENGQPAAWVMHNAQMAVVRGASPEKLLSMMDHSIAVRGASQRWRSSLRNTIDPDEIRGHLWEAERAGIHPDEIGTYLVDSIEETARGGLPSRPKAGQGERLLTVSSLRGTANDPGDDLLDHVVARQGVSDPTGDEVIAAESQSAFQARFVQLRDAASADERVLLDALEMGFREDPHSSVAEIGRRRGWDADDVRAVLRRLQRKADRIR